AAIAVSAKLTASWPLIGLVVAARLAGWRPPPARTLAVPALATAPLFAPIIAFAISGRATGDEIGRRIGFLADLFTSDVIPGAAANLINYLGNWSGILSELIRGAGARPPNVCGLVLVSSTLVWLVVRAVVDGPVPR